MTKGSKDLLHRDVTVENKCAIIAIQKIIVISGSQLYETVPDNLPA